jgi:hypothetical protein
MAKPTEPQLLQLIAVSHDPSDLETRVAQQFGAEHTAAALLLAVKTNGAKWVFGRVPPEPSIGYRMGHSIGRAVPEVVALAFAALLVCAVAYPPFTFVAEGGTSFHMGFHSIFERPSGGNMGYGSVNVPLLAIECLTIAAIGAVAFYVTSRFAKRG